MTKSPPPKRRRADRESPDKRQLLILQAARKCLGERGVKEFTLKNVATEAQVSISLISHYFGGAELLLEAVFQSALLEAKSRKYTKPKDLKGALLNLREVLEQHFRPDNFSPRNLLVWLPIYEDALLDAKVRRSLEKIHHDTAMKVSKTISDVATYRQITVEPMGLAHEFLAYLDGLWIRWCISGRATATRELAAATRFLETALGPLHNP